MKQLIKNLLVAFMMIVGGYAHANNGVIPENPKVLTEQAIKERNQKLLDRLEEINAMDKTKLSRSEKKELRKEVKEIKQQMAIGGGVYISVGALILILILLIILL